jgi:hypothetical protein
MPPACPVDAYAQCYTGAAPSHFFPVSEVASSVTLHWASQWHRNEPRIQFPPQPR